MSKLVDVSIQEIEELLKKKQGNIQTMENMTKSDINKLKKLNEKMDEQLDFAFCFAFKFYWMCNMSIHM